MEERNDCTESLSRLVSAFSFVSLTVTHAEHVSWTQSVLRHSALSGHFRDLQLLLIVKKTITLRQDKKKTGLFLRFGPNASALKATFSHSLDLILCALRPDPLNSSEAKSAEGFSSCWHTAPASTDNPALKHTACNFSHENTARFIFWDPHLQHHVYLSLTSPASNKKLVLFQCTLAQSACQEGEVGIHSDTKSPITRKGPLFSNTNRPIN